MHFDPTISLSGILAAVSFFAAVMIFVVSMRPRIEHLELESSEAKLWRFEHERIARERDHSIQVLAVEVAKIVAMQANAEERIGRMDHLFETVVEKLTERRSGDYKRSEQ